jgi:hypothetical protein
MLKPRTSPRRRDSIQMASGKPGAVHSSSTVSKPASLSPASSPMRVTGTLRWLKKRASASGSLATLASHTESVCKRQALISWVTRRTKRRDRIEMKAISMKATRCPSVRSKIVFNRR